MSELADTLKRANKSGFIYVTGADGVGKSTLSTTLVNRLEAENVSVQRVWLRFPQFTSIPFLIYARLRGLSYYEKHADVRYGYWDFRQSWVMREIFPWFVLMDALLFALYRLYLPYLMGRYIVCERFALDMLVDLAAATDDFTFWKRYPGKLFLKLIPPKAYITILDLDADIIRQRRPALKWDRVLEKRLALYRQLAHDCAFPMISTKQPVESIAAQILQKSEQ